MSINSIVLEGYGTGSTVHSLVTAGYALVVDGGGDFVAPVHRVFDVGAPIPELVTAYTFRATGTAMAGIPSAAYDLSGATITCCIVSHDSREKLTDTVALESDEVGADWAAGDVTIALTDVITAQASDYAESEEFAKIEIKATLSNGEEYAWYCPVRIFQGQIV